jgi:hypothetical protein
VCARVINDKKLGACFYGRGRRASQADCARELDAGDAVAVDKAIDYELIGASTTAGT